MADVNRLDRGQKTQVYKSDPGHKALQLSEAGWVEGSAEREWARYFVSAVDKKV